MKEITPFNANTGITTREARQKLFLLDNQEADALRRELFEIEDQNSPLPLEFVDRFNKATA